MSVIDLYQPQTAAVAIPEAHDIDSWIGVVQDVIKVANVIFDTPFVPDGLRGSAPAVAAAILAGREMGLGPMTSLQHIHVIKGKPGQSALLMRGLIQAAGHKWQDGDVTDTRAVVRGCRKGESEWLEVTFTADQAKRAGIDLGKYPQDKLYARATSRLARRKFADVIMGMPYSADELEDGDDGEAEQPATAPPAAPPRTAQRRGRAPQNVPPADSATPPAQAAPPVPPAGGTPLPPLPGEDEPDPTAGPQEATGSPPSGSAGDEPAHASTGQVGIIRSHFKRLGYSEEPKDTAERLARTGQLAGIDGLIGSTKDLDEVQARTVMDTLSRCKDRDALGVLLAAGDKPGSDG